MSNSDRLQQGSDEWLKARLGVFTASSAAKLVCTSTLTLTALDYIRKKALEEITGQQQDVITINAAMQHGIDCEPIAAARYAECKNEMLAETGLDLWSENNQVGASFDRVILNKNAAIEIKCPALHTHCKYMEIETAADLKKVAKNYYWQIMQQMLVGSFDYIDFVSFCPSLDVKELFILRVERNDKDIQQLKKCLLKAIQKKQQLVKLYKK
ncbi:MAG: YqaJ viral recombinase family protein [Saprospiraceae bacterium]|uniref:lambda exonuclease family protein n=1 Tax=Kordia sp. TaxID=1965332 RepID=UPI0025BC9FC9|nr:lambda exonuclease family protein [Kordia sp.]MCH2045669.1 YqaJ viral recombinase family protein [Saprospiraceae bacterium]MCH2197080.1 YqaJ viral recombinase family protein [Kordia sp.]